MTSHGVESQRGATGGAVVAFGDSITWGFPFGPADSWVRYVADGLGIEIDNQGVNGDTLESMRRRLPMMLAMRPRRVILMGGTNDVSLGRPVPDMAADLTAMAAAVSDSGAGVVIGMPVPYRDPHCEKELASLRHLINAFAGTRKVPVIHFERAFYGADGELLEDHFNDVTHPSVAGYRAMARQALSGGALADLRRAG